MPNLIVERGREKGTSFELRPERPCVAGRDPSAVQIVLSDPAASRRHFQVEMRGNRWVVSDLGSRNHTYVNEEKLEQEKELSSGDRIQVGETVMSFLDEEKEGDKADKTGSQGLNGKEIGGYLILERVGRGGMGTVFKAKQVSLNRVVALKVLASKFAKDPKFVSKFNSEARAAGQLSHPNVVSVYDVGQSGGLHFFSMEFMDGGCVQDLLTAAPEGRLPWQEAMPLILDAARGLVFAEKRGIIHRDIKPDNLMLTSEQRVKIGDLGLAKRAEEGGGDKSIFGTPHFIAPEQAQGREVTHAADLYSLGATFYRMVTGRTPFTGDTVKDILRKQISEPHQPIPEIVPDFPEDLSAILDKLMAKKPEQRYQSATKLVEDLEAFQLAHQIELSGAKKLNKPLMIGSIVVALAAIGVGIYYATRPPQKETETVYVDRPQDPVGPVGPTKTPEEERQLIVTAAENDYLKLRVRDRGEITLDREKDWKEVADDYEALPKAHPDPRAAEALKPALERAKKIRETIDALKAEKLQRETAAKTWWETTKQTIGGFEKDSKWQQAIDEAKKQLADAETAKHMAIVPEAKDELAKVEARELELAEKDFERVRTEAQAAFAAGGDQTLPALETVRQWADALEATAPTHEKLKGFVDEARNWVTDRKTELVASLVSLLEQDRQTYVEAMRGLRQDGGLVFDLKLEEAVARFETAVKALRCYPYAERAAQHLARLRAAQAGWRGWVALLAEGKVFAEGDEVRGLPGMGSGVRYLVNLEDKPTEKQLTVDTVLAGGAGRARKVVDWADLTREELASIFVMPRLDKLPGDVAYGLAWLFQELGHPTAAAALLDRATTVKHAIPPEEETALRREINAVAAYDELRRKAATAGTDPNEIVAAVLNWRQTYAGTATYVYFDGRAARELEILPEAEVTSFLDNLGAKPK